MSITKTGIMTNNILQENGLSTVNYFPGFNNFNSASYSYNTSENKYTIVSAVTTSVWGSGVCLVSNKIRVPHKMVYRVILDIYVPTEHDIQIDINNSPISGTITGGNDNDYGRTITNFNIPAKTWTTIIFGSGNNNTNNTNGVDISPYDAIGLITSGDSSAVTWYIRNPRVYIGPSDEFIKASINSQKIISNQIIEL